MTTEAEAREADLQHEIKLEVRGYMQHEDRCFRREMLRQEIRELAQEVKHSSANRFEHPAEVVEVLERTTSLLHRLTMALWDSDDRLRN